MPSRSSVRIGFRVLAALFFVAGGINHFTKPAMYQAIVPPRFPSPAVLVVVSGIGEIVGGLGLLMRPFRRAAGSGLLVLLVAVFPANVYMALAPDHEPQRQFPLWVLWARLPLQAMLMAWVWWVALGFETWKRKAPRKENSGDGSPEYPDLGL